MNILSLFDGMSCGQIALERAGIKIDNYFASEIDKHAQIVSKANYPNTIYLGDVRNINANDLPKIDLLIGGSPCQSFSFAGKRKGMSTKCEQEILSLSHYVVLKSESFEFEGQSYLFWEYMRLLNECKPKYFLLENVEMGEKWERILSKSIGVNGVHINSALVSAQNRRRIYWTNIGLEPGGLFGDLVSTIKQPKDRGILLKDILENEVDEKYYLSEKMINCFLNQNQKNKENGNGFKFEPKNVNGVAGCLTSRCYKMGVDDNYIVHNTMPRSSTSGKGGTGHLTHNDGKTYCLDTGNTNAVEIKCVAMRGREAILTPKRTDYGKSIRKEYEAGNIKTERKNIQQLEPRTDNKTNCLTSVQKDNLVSIMLWRSKNWGNPENADGKHYTLCKEQPHGIKYNNVIRRLTPLECERLQTVPDNYTNHVSDTQRYKMLGNGWTVDVIVHILKYIKISPG